MIRITIQFTCPPALVNEYVAECPFCGEGERKTLELGTSGSRDIQPCNEFVQVGEHCPHFCGDADDEDVADFKGTLEELAEGRDERVALGVLRCFDKPTACWIVDSDDPVVGRRWLKGWQVGADPQPGQHIVLAYTGGPERGWGLWNVIMKVDVEATT